MVAIATQPTTDIPPLVQQVTRPDGRVGVRYNFHKGQLRAWKSGKRTVLVLAGTRGGKTSFGPCWFHREIKRCGAGDYLIAAPSYPLLNKAAVPAVRNLFAVTLQLGRMNYSPLEFHISPEGEWRLWGARQDKPTRIIFGHADEPDSLEAMEAKAAWSDEAGQKRFKGESFEAITRRLSIDRGRHLLTTTPYFLGGYLKEKIHDPAERGTHPLIDLVRFSSIMNPAFHRDEWERARRELPHWKFLLFFKAIFTRPAGAIYETYQDKLGVDVWPRFEISEHWKRHLGLDFGGVNTAGVYLAAECTADGKPATFGTAPLLGAGKPTGRFFIYREYLPRENRSARDHKTAILAGDAVNKPEPRLPNCVGGSRSEGQWRTEFAQAGLGIMPPTITEIEIGINRVHSLFSAGRLIIFEDLHELRSELRTYSREVDDAGQPTEEIDDPHIYHLCDSLRYIGGYLAAPPAEDPFFVG